MACGGRNSGSLGREKLIDRQKAARPAFEAVDVGKSFAEGRRSRPSISRVEISEIILSKCGNKARDSGTKDLIMEQPQNSVSDNPRNESRVEANLL